MKFHYGISNYVTNKKGATSELVYQLKTSKRHHESFLNVLIITQDYSKVIAETTIHFFLWCQFFNDIRDIPINDLMNRSLLLQISPITESRQANQSSVIWKWCF